MSTETFDPAAWENALIEDLRAHGGTPSQGPLKGHPIMLMYSTGAKSGQRRRAILTYSRDGEGYVVAGTASGSKVDPAWVANLEQDPSAEIEAAGEVFQATATVHRDGPERDRLWERHVARLPWFADYPAQVGGRTIPVVRFARAG